MSIISECRHIKRNQFQIGINLKANYSGLISSYKKNEIKYRKLKVSEISVFSFT